jgi:PAS domain-containing protein
MPVGVNSRILDYKGMRVYFSVIRDITERKKAEEAKDRLLNAISASTKGIAITDEQRQVHLCK